VASVLIIDDEPNIRRMVGALLTGEGYEVRQAADGAAAAIASDEAVPDVALLDLMMPTAADGLATLAALRERDAEMPVIMMSGRAGLADAVRATKLGAFNFLEKPLAPESLLLALSAALELRQARLAARALREALGPAGELVGGSAEMREVLELIARVAPTDARVLVSGESGTGKELVAAAIHRASARRDRPFVRVNCAAIPRDLVESEMFGHERGAFTGATERRVGRFELAHTGTLFLDEVGDLGPEAQAKLLRAIEAREVERVGGSKPVRVDVRILAATNKNLPRAVVEGAFREDLYFRLNVIPLAIPPLRERPGDIPALVRHFELLHRSRTGRALGKWRPEALALLGQYPWPGNVRELGNIVERLAILHPSEEVTAAHVRTVLPQLGGGGGATTASAGGWSSDANGRASPSSSGMSARADALHRERDAPLAASLDAYERTLISEALSASGGNVTEAARRLQTDRPNLYRRMRRLGIAITCVAACASTVIQGLVSPLAAQVTAPATQHDSTARDSVPPDSVPPDTTAARTPATDSTPDSTSAGSERWWRRWLARRHPGSWVGLSVTSAHTYNRVEGLPIYIGPAARGELPWGTIAGDAYGIVRTFDWPRWSNQNLGYGIRSELRIGHERGIAIGGRLYDEVAPVEAWQLSEGEVGLAAFIFHRDYRDYYERHGGIGYVTLSASADASLTLSYANENWSSRLTRDPLTILLDGADWRPNPQLDAGVFRTAGAKLQLDSRNDESDPWAGWYASASVERGDGTVARFGPANSISSAAGPAPGGGGGRAAITYRKGFLDVRRYNRIDPVTQLNVRAVLGGWLGGDRLPLEQRMSVGGAGSIPGYAFRNDGDPGDPRVVDAAACSLPGPRPPGNPALCDRIALAQAEFRHDLPVHLGRWARGVPNDWTWVVFADAGRGWLVGPPDGGLHYPADAFPAPRTFLADAGIGLVVDPVGLYVAQAISRAGLAPRLVVRIRQRF
jgi:DNA-binding NtrC family response regulator